MMSRRSPSTFYQEEASNYELSVTIIQAQNIHGTDQVTSPDCYVYLWLPSALSDRKKTRTIWNSTNPVWNETFHFRVHSQVKNTLELSLHDEDIGTGDDHLYTVSYDLENVPLNEQIVESFTLNAECNEELQVEFKMVPIQEPPTEIITNGVLVCPPMVALEVQVEKLKKEFKKKTELALTVRGSHEGSHRKVLVPTSNNEPGSKDNFVFHYPKDWGTELNANLYRVYSSLDVTFSNDTESDCLASTTVPLTVISPDKEVNIQLPTMEGQYKFLSGKLFIPRCLQLTRDDSLRLEERSFHLQERNGFFPVRVKPLEMQLKSKRCPDNLDVRLGFNLCEKEKQFLQKRKQLVAEALKKILQLKKDLVGEEIPVIAIMATGGGARAMSCLYSHLAGLQKMGLLDCVTYIAGASGSTWTMSKIYEDPEWSQNDLTSVINNTKQHVTRTKVKAFSVDRLKYYRQELNQQAKEGQKTSFTDLWGLMIESMFHDGRNESKLSDQQAALENGQNPLPIYLAMNVKQDAITTLDFKEWCEFTPYEVGLLKYGASIRTEDFGSEFYMGRLMKKHPERRICYLQGLWGNVFSLNLVDTWYLTTHMDNFWDTWIKDRIIDIDTDKLCRRRQEAHMKTRLYTPSGTFSRIFKGVLTNRPIDGEQQNFLRGLHLHKDYHKNDQFSTWKDTHLDIFPNKLTPLADNLCLVDAGYFINASFPPLLTTERKVDIILSFDYTLDTPFLSVEQTCSYCTTQGIGFPNITLSEEDKKNHKECYSFVDHENPNAPMVLHFPLVNDTFKKFKEHGVLRSPEEMSEGEVNVNGFGSPYFLTNFTYSEQDFDRLMKLTQYNIQNNSNVILDALRTAVERRKARNLLSQMYQLRCPQVVNGHQAYNK